MVSIWRKVAVRIGKTRSVLAEGMAQVFGGGGKLDETLLERLEEVLLLSDVGPETAAQIADRLRELASERGVTEASEGQGLMEEVITGILTTGMAATPDGSGPGGVQEHDL
ncbi:MAG: signal recognition particle receptor subunit alpha, partial [Candidatus Eisenbacteria sp.]|nr:signal recognition particle receptor subunit alpha [Candidatus Eisenbacteria bacterium]